MYLHPYDYETMYVYVHFLHGGIAIFGGFPSFFWMLQVQQVQPSAVLQQPFCFKVPKNDSKKIDSPPKKKQIFSDFQIQKTHIFLPNDHLLHLFGQCTGRQTRGFKDLERDASGRVMGCPKKKCRKVQW